MQEEQQQQQQPPPTPGVVPMSGPQGPQSGATATPASVDFGQAGDMEGSAAPSPIDAGAHDGEDDDEVDLSLQLKPETWNIGCSHQVLRNET